jgi:6,7-dimethyl-8-ribityllumazine synthase
MAKPRPPKAKTKSKDEDSLAGARVLVVEARFYDDIANALLDGARRVLDEAGTAVDVITVPGSLEIAPAIAIACDAAKRAKKPYDAAVALGCVIRGETLHYEIVSIESARAILDLSVTLQFPIGNGILTVEDDAQAWVRARPSEEDKGGGAAKAALALLRIKRSVNRSKR